jgi:hypothetical protein
LPVDFGEVGAGVGWDGGGDGSSFGFEAGVVEGSSHAIGGAVLAFDS